MTHGNHFRPPLYGYPMASTTTADRSYAVRGRLKATRIAGKDPNIRGTGQLRLAMQRGRNRVVLPKFHTHAVQARVVEVAQNAAVGGPLAAFSFYDRDGKPIGSGTFERLKRRRLYCRVAFTVIGTYEVSTVWIGMVSNYIAITPRVILVGPPRGPNSDLTGLFQTAVFRDTAPDAEAEHVTEYATEQAAIAGHAELCAMLDDVYGIETMT